MVTALFPGSFDPVTNGHLDLISRAAQIFDHVVVAVGFNMAKPGWMPVAQRVELLRRTVEDQLELDNVSVGQFEGLTTDYAEHVGATVIIKGGRSGDPSIEQERDLYRHRRFQGEADRLQWSHQHPDE